MLLKGKGRKNVERLMRQIRGRGGKGGREQIESHEETQGRMKRGGGGGVINTQMYLILRAVLCRSGA